MTTVAVPRTLGRGRQAAAVELERDRADEARAHYLEDLAFTEHVLAVGTFLSDAPRPAHVSTHFGGELAHKAGRRLVQLRGGQA